MHLARALNGGVGLLTAYNLQNSQQLTEVEGQNQRHNTTKTKSKPKPPGTIAIDNRCVMHENRCDMFTRQKAQVQVSRIQIQLPVGLSLKPKHISSSKLSALITKHNEYLRS